MSTMEQTEAKQSRMMRGNDAKRLIETTQKTHAKRSVTMRHDDETRCNTIQKMDTKQNRKI